MGLTQIGDRWRGEEGDLPEFLRNFDPNISHIAECVCTCGGRVFMVEVDETGACARRDCMTCEQKTYLLDGEEYWIYGDVRYVTECDCGSDEFEVAIGFELYEPEPEGALPDVRWVTIATRCVNDGLLGICADWKIREHPSNHLLTKV